jgi:two-component system chemotaxis response regulator CheB
MTSPLLPQRNFEAVVIGASAGGVEALTVLLPALRGATRASIFVVLHLPRTRPSLLVDVFGARCALPVREAEDKEPVEPGTVYFAPPDYHLLLDRGPRLILSADDPVQFSRPSIDVLFESAAELYRERLLAIILSGASDDGTSGVVAVKRGGGVTVAQSPETAKASIMPGAAVNSGAIDHVFSLERIASLLQGLEIGNAP